MKGTKNKVVDALSKKIYITTLSMCKLDLRTNVLESQNRDATYLQLKEKLQQGNSDKQCKGY